MNSFLYIKVINNIKRFIDKCSKYNIELSNINYINNNEIIVKIHKNDLDKLIQYNYYSDIEIYKKTGIDYLIEKVFCLKYIILVFLICIISMYFISNIILKINVIHSNKKIRELVYNELYNNGIKKYSIKKDFSKIETIRNKILFDNKDKLEWISITNVGMTYVVRVEERILSDIKKTNEYCNIVSNKEAVITNIYSSSGDILVNINDLVKKDDILIDGKIKLEDEIKGYICSNGSIYGNVWYNTNITVKREYQKKKYTGKKRVNFTFKNKVLRNNKYILFDKEYIIKNKLLSIYKEKEYILKNYKYSELDGVNYALEKIEEKFNTKLGKNGKIIKTKIINKNINNNSISLDMFIVTDELISKQVILNKDEE